MNPAEKHSWGGVVQGLERGFWWNGEAPLWADGRGAPQPGSAQPPFSRHQPYCSQPAQVSIWECLPRHPVQGCSRFTTLDFKFWIWVFIKRPVFDFRSNRPCYFIVQPAVPPPVACPFFLPESVSPLTCCPFVIHLPAPPGPDSVLFADSQYSCSGMRKDVSQLCFYLLFLRLSISQKGTNKVLALVLTQAFILSIL